MDYCVIFMSVLAAIITLILVADTLVKSHKRENTSTHPADRDAPFLAEYKALSAKYDLLIEYTSNINAELKHIQHTLSVLESRIAQAQSDWIDRN